MDAREQVDEQVAGNPGPVIAIVAPAEQPVASNGRFGASPRNRAQSQVCGLASGGIVYCHAPIAELRCHHASTKFSSPIAPDLNSSRALA